jgi:hypothetical protein
LNASSWPGIALVKTSRFVVSIGSPCAAGTG